MDGKDNQCLPSLRRPRSVFGQVAGVGYICMVMLAFFRTILIVVPVFITTTGMLQGQPATGCGKAGDTLLMILGQINDSQSDTARDSLNNMFASTLRRVLEQPGGGSCTFEHIPSLIRIAPPGDEFRIYHWNLPDRSGRNRYRGFIRMNAKNGPTVFELCDVSDTLEQADSVILRAPSWFGALYYRVIPGTMSDGRTCYTLLGWSGKDATITRKVIDVLSFGPGNQPVFGAKIFKGYGQGRPSRIIFWYSASTTMSLRCERQKVTIPGSWNPVKRKFTVETIETEVISFDRMVPLDPQLLGQYRFYVPAGELVDRFVQDHGGWTFITGENPANDRP